MQYPRQFELFLILMEACTFEREIIMKVNGIVYVFKQYGLEKLVKEKQLLVRRAHEQANS